MHKRTFSTRGTLRPPASPAYHPASTKCVAPLCGSAPRFLLKPKPALLANSQIGGYGPSDDRKVEQSSLEEGDFIHGTKGCSMAAYCFYRLDKGERIVGLGEY